MLHDGDGLVDDVGHVLLGDVELLLAEHEFHETRIQINEVARAAAEVGEVLDGEAQPARAGGADHDPRLAAREMLVVDLAAELLVVGLVVVPADALLGHAGGAAGLENVVRLALERRGHPDLGLEVAQGLVLEVRELEHVGRALHFLARVEVLLRPVEPVGASGVGAEMPRKDVAEVGVELGLGSGDGFGGNGCGH